MDGSRARAVLGVSEHATLDELRRAFRVAAFATHPDLGGSADTFDRALRALRVLEPLAAPAAPRPVVEPASRVRVDVYDSPAPEIRILAAPEVFADVLRTVMARQPLAA